MPTNTVANVRIVGMTTTVPQGVYSVDDHAIIFGEKIAKSVAANCGVERRPVAESSVCASDLCYDAAERLLKQIKVDRNQIDALIFVTQTPDFLLPATACVLQNRLKLSTECAAFDVNQGCSGYAYGLWMASQMIASRSCEKVLLLVGDTVSKTVQSDDQSTAMLFGDAGSATFLEYDATAPKISFTLGTDGSGAEHLMMHHANWSVAAPDGSAEDDISRMRSQKAEKLYMNGAEVFSFTLRIVPAIFKKILQQHHWEHTDVDSVVMHQANLFILKNLARRLKLQPEQFPISINQFGNTSSASIPITIESQLKQAVEHQSHKAVLIGFGVGLSWGAVAVTLEKCILPGVGIYGTDTSLSANTE